VDFHFDMIRTDLAGVDSSVSFCVDGPGNGAGTNGYRLGNVGAVSSTCEKPTDGNFIVVDFADALLANPERDLLTSVVHIMGLGTKT
jgi:hypothetical protein